MEKIMFSIVVICLNPGNRLGMTIDSIRTQTYDNYEIIVKDGMSEDGSVEALPKDKRMQIHREKDTGIYDAMNQAVKKVSGDYVYFLNCGDVFYDTDVLYKVNQQIKSNINKKQSIFYGDIFERLTAQRVSSNPNMDAFGCYRNVPCHQACFYESELVRQKSFEVEYKVRADYEHFLWCFFKGNAAMIYMPFLIANYEGGGFSETRKNRKRSAEEHRNIIAKYMTKKQIVKYRLIMILTLSTLRTWMARNEATARVYNKVKSLLYRNV